MKKKIIAAFGVLMLCCSLFFGCGEKGAQGQEPAAAIESEETLAEAESDKEAETDEAPEAENDTDARNEASVELAKKNCRNSKRSFVTAGLIFSVRVERRKL